MPLKILIIIIIIFNNNLKKSKVSLKNLGFSKFQVSLQHIYQKMRNLKDLSTSVKIIKLGWAVRKLWETMCQKSRKIGNWPKIKYFCFYLIPFDLRDQSTEKLVYHNKF